MWSQSEKVPIPGKRNILVTSALPYVNNVPHLGNIIGSVLSADVFARFFRLRGYNVLFVSGNDEYGTTTEVRAAVENVTPRAICDKFHPLHKDIYDWFDISFDQFGRTSTPQHTDLCHQILTSLNANNMLVHNIYEQLYCEECSKFLADNLVEGQCPRCLLSCKGEECEQCGAFVKPRDLLNPICKICGSSSLTLRTSDHLFLQVDCVKQGLHALFDRLTFSNQHAMTQTRNLLHKELLPKCITRDLKWGVPVPSLFEKFKEKVLYVWFDAPIGYISITKCHTPKWELWWKNREDVELHHFMGKDNVPFHSVYFPSYLLGTGEKWTLPNTIHATHFLLFGGGKFSKSKGVGIFGDDAKKTNIPTDVWRYYLISVRPEASDSRFSWEDLQVRLNSELNDNLGNFVNRVLTFVAKPPGKGYDSVIPDVPADVILSEIDIEFGDSLKGYVHEYVKALEKLKDGLKAAMAIASEGNRHFQRTKVWKLYTEDKSRCCFVVKTLVGVVCILACLLQPFMPSFTTQVLKQLNLEVHELLTLHDEDIERVQRPWEVAPAGHKIGHPSPLFRKLSNNEVEKLEKEFCGSQTDPTETVVLDSNKLEVNYRFALQSNGV